MLILIKNGCVKNYIYLHLPKKIFFFDKCHLFAQILLATIMTSANKED